MSDAGVLLWGRGGEAAAPRDCRVVGMAVQPGSCGERDFCGALADPQPWTEVGSPVPLWPEPQKPAVLLAVCSAESSGCRREGRRP